MSSHHFVKEGQEPALLILRAVPFAVVEPLLEWAPLVMVDEKVLDDVLLWGIKIDVVITEYSEETLTKKLADQAPVKIISSDRSTLEIALSSLSGMKQSAVNIVTSAEKELLKTLETFRDQLVISVVDGERKWLSVPAGNFRKWYEKNTILEIAGSPEFSKLVNIEKKHNSYVVQQEGLAELESSNPYWLGEML